MHRCLCADSLMGCETRCPQKLSTCSSWRCTFCTSVCLHAVWNVLICWRGCDWDRCIFCSCLLLVSPCFVQGMVRTLRVATLVHTTFSGTSWIYLTSHVNHWIALCFINLTCNAVMSYCVWLLPLRRHFIKQGKYLRLSMKRKYARCLCFFIYQYTSECCFLKLQFWTS